MNYNVTKGFDHFKILWIGSLERGINHPVATLRLGQGVLKKKN